MAWLTPEAGIAVVMVVLTAAGLLALAIYALVSG
jgi:hypothetical protein